MLSLLTSSWDLPWGSGPLWLRSFCLHIPDAQGPNRIRAAEADDGIPTLDLLKLAFEIDKSTLDRIDELSRPITDQSDGPDWREYDGSTVEQRREAFVYREVRRAVEHLYDLVQRPTWYEE